ncbi:MAG: endonuclease NucS domain-containing protein [Methanobacterium formicicum]
MTTEIGVWEVINGKLEPIDVSLAQAGRRESEDLEKWIKNNPVILGQDILIIGEQVRTKSGPLDLLGIDKSGDLVIVELKRDKLPREVIAQALDYVSDVASWDLDRISDECLKFSGSSLEDYLNENFDEIEFEDLKVNENQRLLLVGFAIDEPLERMIEWLSNNYGVGVNAIILKYIQTRSNEEFIARTMIIPEDLEKERIRKKRNKFLTSDKPGNYDPKTELKPLLKQYLAENRKTPQRIKEILLPLCLKNDFVTREMIKKELINKENVSDEGKAGLILTTISREIGFANRDYLRQIIEYDKPNPWEKENYKIIPEYRDLVKELLKN